MDKEDICSSRSSASLSKIIFGSCPWGRLPAVTREKATAYFNTCLLLRSLRSYVIATSVKPARCFRHHNTSQFAASLRCNILRCMYVSWRPKISYESLVSIQLTSCSSKYNIKNEFFEVWSSGFVFEKDWNFLRCFAMPNGIESCRFFFLKKHDSYIFSVNQPNPWELSFQ